MTSRDRIDRAARTVARVAGAMALVLASGRGLTRRAILGWAADLRAAADEIEETIR